LSEQHIIRPNIFFKNKWPTNSDILLTAPFGAVFLGGLIAAPDSVGVYKNIYKKDQSYLVNANSY
jgi:hypothetical protein